MSEAFRGEFNQKVDAKARVSIPAPFRRVLEAGDPSCEGGRPKFVMVYGRPNCAFVECYTIAGMKRLEARIRLMAPGTRERRLMERNFVTLSQLVEVDDDGRIVLPPKGREKIGLVPEIMKDGAEAVFAGTLDTFQIWHRAAYEAELSAEEDADLDFLADGADLLSLLPPETER
ncbi:MAG: division/cell wall cluster transcriptional repressor MraZ [Gemmobacter sp.]